MSHHEMDEDVNALIGEAPKALGEGEKIDYDATKAPPFSAENQPGKKKKKKDEDE